MANRKLTELPLLTSIPIASTDFFYLVDRTDDVSKAITYDALAGNGLITLSAYAVYEKARNDLQDIDLSNHNVRINNNVNSINAVEGDVNVLQSDMADVSGDLTALSGTNDLLSNTITELLILSANLFALEGDLDEIFDEFELTVPTLTADVNFLSAAIDSAATGDNADINFLSGAIVANDNFLSAAIVANHNFLSAADNFLSAAIDINSTYVNQVSVVPTAETPAQTHTVPINIGGTIYKILLAT